MIWAVIFVLLLFAGCQSDKATLSPLNGIFQTSMRLSDSIVELQPMTTGLKQVVVPKRPQSYSLDSLVESISYVRLETRSECLLGDIDKIIATPAVLFILDKRNSSVLRFDKMGKFLGRIGGQGRGPGEYQSVYDIAVTSLKLLGDPLNVEDEHFVKNTDMEDNPILAFIKLRSQSIR